MMFGLFKSRRIPVELSQKVQVLANEAQAQCARLIQDGTLQFPDWSVEYSKPAIRDQLRIAFYKYWRDLPKNRDAWNHYLRETAARQDSSDVANVERAALCIVVALTKTDTVCRIAREFPKDLELEEFAYLLMSETLVAFDMIMDDRFGQRGEFESGPSDAIREDLQFASQVYSSFTENALRHV